MQILPFMSLRTSLAVPKNDKYVLVQWKHPCYFSTYLCQSLLLCIKDARIYEKGIAMEQWSKKY